jgi:DNA modification methylase
MITNSNSLALPIASGIAQTCVTSPPYYGLRDYGEEGQIGLEETPEAYVNKLVEVFREVWRTLKDDGTLWLNLGDSYASNGNSGMVSSKSGLNHGAGVKGGQKSAYKYGRAITPDGMKPKDLIGIPWMVAFALRADGWYLRQDIIWAKPNPMPESVKDRCTKSHEYIFLLSKSQKYYYDADAIKTPSIAPDDDRGSRQNRKRFPTETINGIRGPGIYPMANKRSVWTVNTSPYKGAHFATFPPKLIEPCVLAGSRAGDLVIDPFNGSGTTGQVSLQHGRRYYGSEINLEYIALTKTRLNQTQTVMI